MSSPVIVVFEGTSIDLALERMLNEKISSLVVVDDDKKICGILTTEDLLRYFLKRYQEETADPGLSFSNIQIVGNIMHTLSQAGI
jgi:CBS domain containing-hemolysin-like protein